MREDIVLAMEYHDLTDEQAKALLASPSPLDEIFHDFENIEGDHMDVIRDCIESGANKNIEKQREELRSLPVYTFSATFAKEHGELETYRTSHRANVACKNAIEEAISSHYRDNRFDGSCVDEVIDRFGMERVAFVLANTVQDKDWDGRISHDNKAWAKMCRFRMIMTHGAADVLMSMSAPKLTPVLSIYSSTALERNRSLQQRKSRLCSKS